MAMPMIETGYKPDGALGALYQGFNAANAEESAQLELIKQFLANQKSLREDPLDAQTKEQNLLINSFKTDPRYQEGMLSQTEGQGKTMLSSGNIAEALRPFRQKAERAELDQKYNDANRENEIAAIDQELQTADDATRNKLLGLRQHLVDRAINTPQGALKLQLAGDKNNTALEVARLRAEADAAKAAARGGAVKDKQIEFQKLSPSKRIAIVDKALDLGVDPIYGEPLSDKERLAWEHARSVDKGIVELQSQPKAGTVDIGSVGNIKTNPAPNIDANVTKPSSPVDEALRRMLLAEKERRAKEGK